MSLFSSLYASGAYEMTPSQRKLLFVSMGCDGAAEDSFSLQAPDCLITVSFSDSLVGGCLTYLDFRDKNPLRYFYMNSMETSRHWWSRLHARCIVYLIEHVMPNKGSGHWRHWKSLASYAQVDKSS